jgi:hypothetical protein
MRLLAFRFPVERVEGVDEDESLPRVAALIDVSASRQPFALCSRPRGQGLC